ncbi:hypothetical protein FCL38_00470 [Pseudoduganella umbonata]|uniref:OmpA family protein n=1 Tax=Pseudoduganella umbonata TaxID=864828 RepID=A0ABX5UDW9_9BURK|nr:hypothetical protein FCL38_00470 [Pseudoduganella umbonata]
MSLAITPLVHRGTSRFAFCATGTCSVASPKTPAGTGVDYRPATAATAPPGRAAGQPAQSIDLPFAFNATALRAADLRRLRATVKETAPVSVRITGRSDALGEPSVRQRIALARADAVRTAVLAATPGADVTIDHEISTDTAVPAATRRHQRRATVHLIPTPTRP